MARIAGVDPLLLAAGLVACGGGTDAADGDPAGTSGPGDAGSNGPGPTGPSAPDPSPPADPRILALHEALDLGVATLSPQDLGEVQPEPHPSWMTRISDDWTDRYGAGR